jgi:hypothetical protein
MLIIQKVIESYLKSEKANFSTAGFLKTPNRLSYASAFLSSINNTYAETKE